MLLTISVGLFVLLFSAMVALIITRKTTLKTAPEKKDEKIAQFLLQERADHTYRTLEHLIQNLPSGISDKDFLKELENVATKLQHAASDLSIRDYDQSPSWKMVESLVHGYHTQALHQAKVQFWFSVGAAVVGFVLIVYMVAGASGSSNLELLTRTLPGLIIDAVAALFFKQANETRQRATALYDRLRADSQTNKALALVESIPDSRMQSILKGQLALRMAGFTLPDLDLSILPGLSQDKDKEP